MTTRNYATFFGGKLHPKQVQIGEMANGAKIYGEPDDPRAASHEAKLEEKGAQARRECRSRSPFMMTNYLFYHPRLVCFLLVVSILLAGQLDGRLG